MGPTNVALVNLFKADQRLRDARERLDAAARGVRVQERRANDLAEKLRLAQQAQNHQKSRYLQLELDIKTRDAHIEKLRTQQQTTHNNREYQAFLVEINTSKVDRGKVEDEAMKLVETMDKGKGEVASLQTQLDGEKAKLETMKAQINDALAALQKEVDELVPDREAAAKAVPAKAREVFERLADHHEGEALSAIGKPDRRREEYLCMACNMELAQDVYNKLRVRDDLVYCPSCRRILYIPEDLSPELALGTKKPAVVRKPRVVKAKTAAGAAAATAAAAATPEESVVVIEPRARGKLGEALAKAQGESVERAAKADHAPFSFEVHVDGNLAGIYKGISAEHLERAVKFFMGEMQLTGEVRVIPEGITAPAGEQPAADATAAAAPDTPPTEVATTEASPVEGGPAEPAAVEPAATEAAAASDSEPSSSDEPVPQHQP